MGTSESKHNILIVEDSPQNIDLLVDILKPDYKLSIVRNGEKALEHIFGGSIPDLILLDIVMPVMDGYEVCQKLKEEEKTKDIPVIFLSAKTKDDDIVKGFELGAEDYVTKPFNRTELLARVRTHLELKLVKDKIQRQLEQLKELKEQIKEHDFTGASQTINKILQK